MNRWQHFSLCLQAHSSTKNGNMIYFRLAARVSIVNVYDKKWTSTPFSTRRLLDRQSSIDRLPIYGRMDGGESVARDKNEKDEESLVLQCGYSVYACMRVPMPTPTINRFIHRPNIQNATSCVLYQRAFSAPSHASSPGTYYVIDVFTYFIFTSLPSEKAKMLGTSSWVLFLFRVCVSFPGLLLFY